MKTRALLTIILVPLLGACSMPLIGGGAPAPSAPVAVGAITQGRVEAALLEFSAFGDSAMRLGPAANKPGNQGKDSRGFDNCVGSAGKQVLYASRTAKTVDSRYAVTNTVVTYKSAAEAVGFVDVFGKKSTKCMTTYLAPALKAGLEAAGGQAGAVSAKALPSAVAKLPAGVSGKASLMTIRVTKGDTTLTIYITLVDLVAGVAESDIMVISAGSDRFNQVQKMATVSGEQLLSLNR